MPLHFPKFQNLIFVLISLPVWCFFDIRSLLALLTRRMTAWKFSSLHTHTAGTRWPRGLRRGSKAVRLPVSHVRFPPVAVYFVKNNNHLHLRWVGRQGETKRERYTNNFEWHLPYPSQYSIKTSSESDDIDTHECHWTPCVLRNMHRSWSFGGFLMWRFFDISAKESFPKMSKNFHMMKRLCAQQHFFEFKLFVTIRQKSRQMHETLLSAVFWLADIFNGRNNTCETFHLQND